MIVKKTQVELESRKWANTFPSKVIRVPVDKDAVLRNGIVDFKDADKIVPYIGHCFKRRCPL